MTSDDHAGSPDAPGAGFRRSCSATHKRYIDPSIVWKTPRSGGHTLPANQFKSNSAGFSLFSLYDWRFIMSFMIRSGRRMSRRRYRIHEELSIGSYAQG
jgi:hypothetical protein